MFGVLEENQGETESKVEVFRVVLVEVFEDLRLKRGGNDDGTRLGGIGNGFTKDLHRTDHDDLRYRKVDGKFYAILRSEKSFGRSPKRESQF